MLSALIIAVGIVLAAFIYTKNEEKFKLKARPGKYSVAVTGRTEEAETISITCTIFNDDTAEQVKEKIQGAFDIREARLQFQNERMLALQEEHKKGLEKARDERLKQVEAEQAAAKDNVINIPSKA